MPHISSTKVLFIKLGAKGEWEADCIENGILRLGYDESSVDLFKSRDWHQIEENYLQSGKTQIATTGYMTQIRYFFEEEVDTIWITFFNNKLWWTKSPREVLFDDVKGKFRRCVNGWSDKDILGNTLFMENLSGNLLKTQGFRGTICTVEAQDYLIRKINGIKSESVLELEKTYSQLKTQLANQIKELTWQDFEVLIDLIFTRAGWQRVSAVGKTAKSLDLDLKAPVTGEKCFVQIKSSSSKSELADFLKNIEGYNEYQKIYYVCHSFNGDLSEREIQNKNVRLMLINEISELAIDSGLSKWILSKVS
ncbi:restriction endonuclease [Bdellovibrio bacteriovorus]|uniref:restriction endonuclease n=1 Tax=Bdellovibrio bacteriovorus TaxID=959 RepID=UPI003D00268A